MRRTVDSVEIRSVEERLPAGDIELIGCRDEKAQMHFHLVTGDTVDGTVRWFDDRVICVARPGQTDITLTRSAIASYERKP